MSAATTVYPDQTNADTVTRFIPLTTVFTYNAACSKSLLLEGATIEAFEPGYDNMLNVSLSCVPPAVISSAFVPNNNALVPTIFSLGPLTCPQSWTTVTKSTLDQSSTYAVCCPSDYNTLTGDFCLSTVTKNEVVTFASAVEATGPYTWSMVTSTASPGFTVIASAILGWNIAPPITSTTSSPAAPAHQTSSTPSQTTQSSSIASQPSTSLPAQSKGTSSNGMSTGVKAAIGVSIPLGVVLIVVLLAVFMIHRRKRAAATKKAPDPSKTEDLPYGQKPELSGEGKYTGELAGEESREMAGSETLAAELEMPRGQELSAEHTRLELLGESRRQELSAEHTFMAELHGESMERKTP